MNVTLLTLLLLINISPALLASEANELSLSLDKLFNLKVTSVSGTEMSIKESPAAIYVITPEDMRAQGHLTVADALRNVPGFHVAQINSSTWAITSRGFNSRFANKLLVLIDGRSVYTPLFSGVYWDAQDMVLEDIDRIEVIRGPGATLWGANAVNGVINIVTKSARDSLGTFLKLGTGSHEKAFTSLRHGEQINDDTFYRLWVKYVDRDASEKFHGEDVSHAWDVIQGGLRIDSYLTAVDTLSWQYNVTSINLINTYNLKNPDAPSLPFSLIPGVSAPLIAEHSHEYKINQNTLLSWDKSLTSTSGFKLKAYYDFTRYANEIISEDRHTIDVDFRHWLDLNSTHSLIYGFNFNSTRDKITPSITVNINHMKRQDLTYSAFIQNTTKLNDYLSLMIGSKFEHNNYTGVEIQPSIRMTYNYSDDTSMWASWSRAIRRPSRTDDDLIFNETFDQTIPNPFAPGNVTLPFSATILGDPKQNSEELLAYEAGIRTALWGQKLTLDLVTFYNDYSQLSTFEPGSDPSLVTRRDDSHADAYGIEFSLKFLASQDLNIIANYTWFKMQFPNGSAATVDDTPQHLFNFQTNYQLYKNLNWHTVVYYTDVIASQEIPSYIRVDSGLVWEIDQHSSLAVWGKNLTDPQHPEYNDTIFNSFTYEISRSFFIEYNYNF